MTADDAWEAQRDDVFNVVADVDVPSERIRYAFLAGYCAAAGLVLKVQELKEERDAAVNGQRLVQAVQAEATRGMLKAQGELDEVRAKLIVAERKLRSRDRSD